MSGGYFDHQQYRLGEIAEKIEEAMEGCGYQSNTIAKFHEGVRLLGLAAVAVQRIDWLLSGDDGEETFHERWDRDMEEEETFHERWDEEMGRKNLRPCPFCGKRTSVRVRSAAEILEEECDHTENYAVVCSYLKEGCGSTGGFCLSKSDAIMVWNRRH